MNAVDHIRWGCERPFDNPDDGGPPYIGAGVARRAVYGILHDLGGRGGIKRELGRVDEDVRCEIVSALTAIVREAIDQASSDGIDAVLAAARRVLDSASEPFMGDRVAVSGDAISALRSAMFFRGVMRGEVEALAQGAASGGE